VESTVCQEILGVGNGDGTTMMGVGVGVGGGVGDGVGVEGGVRVTVGVAVGGSGRVEVGVKGDSGVGEDEGKAPAAAGDVWWAVILPAIATAPNTRKATTTRAPIPRPRTPEGRGAEIVAAPAD